MELKVFYANSNDLFLEPQPKSLSETNGLTLREPVILQVIIQFIIPTGCTPPSKLSSVTASLVGIESIGFLKGGYEQNQLYCHEKTIASASDLKLETGSIYQFEVSFAVDHNTAEYQRCKYGRHHQKVKVKATFSGSVFGKKTLTAEKNVFFVHIVSQNGLLPYYYVHQGATEGLGPVFVAVQSAHLTVGGYLRLILSLSSPSPTLRLHSFKLALVQQVTLKSRQRRGYTEKPPLQRFVFFEADKDELEKCIGKEEQDDLDGLVALAKQQNAAEANIDQASWVARLPNNSEARASSLPGADCAIHMAHALEVTIEFSDPEIDSGQTKSYHSTWGLILPSCACRLQSMRLPSYSPHDSNPVPTVPRDFWAGRNEHESIS